MSTPFADWLGMRFETADDGAREIVLDVQPHHTNRRGVLHGGVVSSLLDSALGAAVVAAIKPEEWCGTVSLHVQFQRPARGPRVAARARLDSRGERVAFATCELVDALGKVCARAQGVWHVWPGHPDG